MNPSKTGKIALHSAELAASQRSGEAANSAGATMERTPASGERPPLPDSEVIARPQRRRFTAEYKRSILRQADACQAHIAQAGSASKSTTSH